MSRRVERVGNLIRTVLAEALQQRLSDPRLEPLTSITHVDVAADFSIAHVYVSVMAEESRQKLTLQALRSASGRLRSIVAQQVVVRQVPRLEFHLDHSVQESFRTVQAIDQAMAELGERPPWERERAAAPGEADADEDVDAAPEDENAEEDK